MRERGPEQPMTRLAAFIVSTYIDRSTGIARPSVETIANGSAMSKRAAIEHVNRAIELGWLLRRTTENRSSEMGWRRSEYELSIPPGVVKESNHESESAVTQSYRDVVTHSNHDSKGVVTFTQKRGDSDDKNVVTDDHPIITTISKSIRTSTPGVNPLESFEQFYRRYPRKVAKSAASRAWLKLRPNEELLQVILYALERHKRSDQWTRDDGKFIPHASTWINGRRWEDELDNQPSREGDSRPKRNGGAWWADERSTIAKGRELGIEARPGEDMPQFQQRIREAIARNGSVRHG